MITRSLRRIARGMRLAGEETIPEFMRELHGYWGPDVDLKDKEYDHAMITFLLFLMKEKGWTEKEIVPSFMEAVKQGILRNVDGGSKNLDGYVRLARIRWDLREGDVKKLKAAQDSQKVTTELAKEAYDVLAKYHFKNFQDPVYLTKLSFLEEAANGGTIYMRDWDSDVGWLISSVLSVGLSTLDLKDIPTAKGEKLLDSALKVATGGRSSLSSYKI